MVEHRKRKKWLLQEKVGTWAWVSPHEGYPAPVVLYALIDILFFFFFFFSEDQAEGLPSYHFHET